METEESLNILLISHATSVYGATKSLLNLIDGSNEAVNYTVLLPQNKSKDLIEELSKRGVSVEIVDFKLASADSSDIIEYNLKRLIFPCINFFRVYQICKMLKGRRIDIVHENTGVTNIGQSIARKLHAKHVWHLREFQDIDHGLTYFGGKSKLKKQLQKSDAVISISKSISDYFDVEDCEVIFNGVRATVSEPNLLKSDYFLFVGVIKREKGIEDAIRAFESVHQVFPDLEFWVLGQFVSREYEQYINELVLLKGLHQHIKFLGYKQETDIYYKRALALLMCSKNEAMGRVTAEALILGCPVIGYLNMGTQELLVHLETGFLYKTEDDLVAWMITVFKDGELRNRIINNAQSYAGRNLLESNYVAKVLNVYKKVLSPSIISNI